jgi:ribosome-associated protein
MPKASVPGAGSRPEKAPKTPSRATGQTRVATTRKTPRSRSKDPATVLRDAILKALEDGKGIDVVVLDVRKLCSFTDTMVIATGNTGRQVNALVQRVLEAAAKLGVKPIGSEGRESAEWVLVDFADIVVHVMQKDARQLYELEKLWSELPADGESTGHA